MNNGTKSQIYVLCNDVSFGGLLEHVKAQQEEASRAHFKYTLDYEEDEDYIGACLIDSDGVSDKIGVCRIIVTQRGLCNDIFYNDIREFGNIYNGHLKMDKHNQVMSFETHGIQIYEHESYNGVQMNMDKLILDISKEQ